MAKCTAASRSLPRQREVSKPVYGAGPRRVFAHDRIEAGERGAGEEGGFGLGYRGMDGARPGRERRRGGGRGAWDGGRIGAREHAGRYRVAALLASLRAANRRARRCHCLSDKIALSDMLSRARKRKNVLGLFTFVDQ